MSLPDKWAILEDFATLFQYFWHRDFPVSQKSLGARRTDWTIHIGIVVRSIADLMGLVTRFESGGRKDAVLRSGEGDEVAIEWEWGGAWGNELDKLKRHKAWRVRKDVDRELKYTVFITYAHSPNLEKVNNQVAKKWEDAKWPLLLILVEVEKSKRFSSGRAFKWIHMSVFDSNGQKPLRKVPAYPWNVESSRWYVETS